MVDIDLFVSGPLHMLPRLQEVLKGKNNDFHGLTVSRNLIIFLNENRSLFMLMPTVWTIRQAQTTTTR